jgi:hypothetical protein
METQNILAFGAYGPECDVGGKETRSDLVVIFRVHLGIPPSRVMKIFYQDL